MWLLNQNITKIKNSRGKEIVEAKSEVEDTSEIEKDLNLNAIESVPFDEPEAKETEPDEESENSWTLGKKLEVVVGENELKDKLKIERYTLHLRDSW